MLMGDLVEVYKIKRSSSKVVGCSIFPLAGKSNTEGHRFKERERFKRD